MWSPGGNTFPRRTPGSSLRVSHPPRIPQRPCVYRLLEELGKFASARVLSRAASPDAIAKGHPTLLATPALINSMGFPFPSVYSLSRKLLNTPPVLDIVALNMLADTST